MGNMTKFIKFIMIGILAMFLPLAGWVQGDKNPASPSGTLSPSAPNILPKPAEVSPQPEESRLEKPPKKLEILSHIMVKEEGTFAVIGTAKNTGASTLKYTEILVEFKDAAGKTILYACPLCEGVPQTVWRDMSLKNLKPGETWDFKVVFLPINSELINNVNSYDIEVGVLR